MPGIQICSSCKRSVSVKDIKSGMALQNDSKTLCPNCVQNVGNMGGMGNNAISAGNMNARRSGGGSEESVFILQAMLNVVKNINRAVTYEKSSWLNIFGVVVQCLVFGLLVFACLSRKEITQTALMLALIFQVMALTFFVIKK